MEFLDFDVKIGAGTGREYPVDVLRSPAGEPSGTLRFPFDTLALKSHLQSLEIALLRSGGVRRDISSTEQRAVRDFGKGLFEALMSDRVRECYRRSRDSAHVQSKGLRVRLRIEAPELACLPWEFLYDGEEGDYVSLSTETPIVRYIELERPPPALTVQPPLHILGMVASPSDRARLDVERERHRIEAAVEPLRDAGLIKLTWLDGQGWRDVQRVMHQGPFHIFHFVGHGGFDETTGEGLLALADEQGRTYRLFATNLGRLLAAHSSLRLVVLNSCEGARGSDSDIFSSTASVLIRRGVPAVVAMQYDITDSAAVEFGRALYEALAEGLPVDVAVAEARKSISLSVNNTVEWGTPVLHMRSPDGVLFQIKGLTPSVARTSGAYKTRPQLGLPGGVSHQASQGPAPTPLPKPRFVATRWRGAILGGLLAILLGIIVQQRSQEPGSNGDRVPGVVSMQDAHDLWSRAVTQLVPLVHEARAPNGGFRGILNAVGQDEGATDVWTTAQCFTALVSVLKTSQFTEQEIARTLEYFASEGKNGLWPRWPTEEPSTEVAAWVGLAYVEAPAPDSASLQAVLDPLLQWQSGLGGWASFETTYPQPDLARAAYATNIAMTFLLRLWEKDKRFREQLNGPIKKGLRWILADYQPDIGTWEDVRGEGPHYDLTTLNLLVLARARHLNFPLGGRHAHYMEALTHWLERLQEESRTRPPNQNQQVKQHQHIYDGSGNPVKLTQQGATLLWFPWSLLLTRYLTSDTTLSQKDRQSANIVAAHLWPRLPGAVNMMSNGVTYSAAELLYALGLIGEELNWRVTGS